VWDKRRNRGNKKKWKKELEQEHQQRAGHLRVNMGGIALECGGGQGGLGSVFIDGRAGRLTGTQLI